MFKVRRLLILGLFLFISSGCVDLKISSTERMKGKSLDDDNNRNDEVCLNGDSIVKITLYSARGKMISNSDTKKCFSKKEEREKGNWLETENKDGEKNIILYDNSKSKKASFY